MLRAMLVYRTKLGVCLQSQATTQPPVNKRSMSAVWTKTCGCHCLPNPDQHAKAAYIHRLCAKHEERRKLLEHEMTQLNQQIQALKAQRDTLRQACQKLYLTQETR